MSATLWAPRLVLPVSPDRDHICGSANAPLVIVEYGDYECPHCRAAHLVIKEILERLGEELQYVFRHFPLTAVHPHAEPAAEAVEAAGAQGKFWEMHDVLFSNQERLAGPCLLDYAKMLGLDVERFGLELAKDAYAPKVREDFMSGVRSGVNGTPTFFINGLRHDGDWDLPSFVLALREAAGSDSAC
jgi:protein-disulfide isomerase